MLRRWQHSQLVKHALKLLTRRLYASACESLMYSIVTLQVVASRSDSVQHRARKFTQQLPRVLFIAVGCMLRKMQQVTELISSCITRSKIAKS